MDDANGRAAAGQIALRAPKADDEECVVVATRRVGVISRASRWEPLASARGSWTLVQRKRDC